MSHIYVQISSVGQEIERHFKKCEMRKEKMAKRERANHNRFLHHLAQEGQITYLKKTEIPFSKESREKQKESSLEHAWRKKELQNKHNLSSEYFMDLNDEDDLDFTTLMNQRHINRDDILTGLDEASPYYAEVKTLVDLPDRSVGQSVLRRPSKKDAWQDQTASSASDPARQAMFVDARYRALVRSLSAMGDSVSGLIQSADTAKARKQLPSQLMAYEDAFRREFEKQARTLGILPGSMETSKRPPPPQHPPPSSPHQLSRPGTAGTVSGRSVTTSFSLDTSRTQASTAPSTRRSSAGSSRPPPAVVVSRHRVPSLDMDEIQQHAEFPALSSKGQPTGTARSSAGAFQSIPLSPTQLILGASARPPVSPAPSTNRKDIATLLTEHRVETRDSEPPAPTGAEQKKPLTIHVPPPLRVRPNSEATILAKELVAQPMAQSKLEHQQTPYERQEAYMAPQQKTRQQRDEWLHGLRAEFKKDMSSNPLEQEPEVSLLHRIRSRTPSSASLLPPKLIPPPTDLAASPKLAFAGDTSREKVSDDDDEPAVSLSILPSPHGRTVPHQVDSRPMSASVQNPAIIPGSSLIFQKTGPKLGVKSDFQLKGRIAVSSVNEPPLTDPGRSTRAPGSAGMTRPASGPAFRSGGIKINTKPQREVVFASPEGGGRR